MTFLFLAIVALAAYIIGSIPFGLIVSKLFLKQDIREIGSGNIGATNVLRTGSKALALATLIFDALKGAMAALLSFWMIGAFNQGDEFITFGYTIALVCGLIAIIGHCFPIWLKFKGGKGVATALGVLIAATPYVGLVAAVTWILALLAFRMSSLAALIAAAVAPVATFFIYGTAPAAVCVLITALIFDRHKDNIKRLLNGTEPKIGRKKTEAVDVAPVSK